MLSDSEEELILEKCRSCNSKDLEICTTKKSFPLYIWPLAPEFSTPELNIHVHLCKDCGYLQLQNIEQDQLEEIYREEAFNVENHNQNIERLSLLTQQNSNRFINKKVLEIGGGRNCFVSSLSSETKKWVADFDVDKSVKDKVDGSFEGDFTKINTAETNFDFIFMFHVLEHFNNPSAAVLKARDLLRDEGSLIVEVPSFSYETFFRPHYTFFHMHISLFTEEGLLSFLSRKGFKCKEIYDSGEVLFLEFIKNDEAVYKNLYEETHSLITENTKRIEKCSRELQCIIDSIESGELAIFGAGGASTLFLSNYDFLLNNLIYAIDNDENKIGRYLCNGRVEIIKPDKIEELNIKNVIFLEESHIKNLNNEINCINISKIYGSI